MGHFVEKVALFAKMVFYLVGFGVPALLYGLFIAAPKAIAGFLWLETIDTFLFLGNILTPDVKKGTLIKPGKPGHGGIWPPFVPPTKSDSRAPCPGLNAMANHGILPHSGKHIPLDELAQKMVDTFNFSTTLAKNTTDAIGGLYGRDWIDLADLSAHNIVEHDGSLIRHDSFWEPDQTVIAHDLIKDMLSSATGPRTPEHPDGQLTPADLAKFLALREARSKRDNPYYQNDVKKSFFGVSNATLMYEVCRGDVKTLETFLKEERLPEGFESSADIFFRKSKPKLSQHDQTTGEKIKKAAEAA